jgi:hypothetical protein
MIVAIGLLSIAWTAYELGRISTRSPARAMAWDGNGRPLRVDEVA